MKISRKNKKIKKQTQFLKISRVRGKEPTVENFLKKYHKINDKFFSQFFTWEDMKCDEHQSVSFKNCKLVRHMPRFAEDCVFCKIGKVEKCICDQQFYPVGTHVDEIEYCGYDPLNFELKINGKLDYWWPTNNVVGKFVTSYEIQKRYGLPMPYYMI